jgi:hypothetical protein
MAFSDLFDETIPAEIRRLALERITSRQSFLTRSDIDAGTKTLALILVHLAVPDFHLTKPEEAFRRGRKQEND